MELKNINLYKNRDKLKELENITYQNIYSKCVKLIEITCEKGFTKCQYEIPNFVIGEGYSIIEPVECAIYIRNRVRKENPTIKTKFINPNIIIFDWTIYE